MAVSSASSRRTYLSRHPLVAAGALLVVGMAIVPAHATSVLTDAFVANVRPNVDFLDRASRMALDKSKNGALRRFAHDEALEQTIAANSLVAWTQSNTVSGAADALGVPPDNSAATIAAAPVDAAAAVTNGVGDVVTGRSVAVDDSPPLTVTRAPTEPRAGADGVLPAGADNLARLSALSGRRFDALYVNTQRDSLRQLSTLYADYIRNGEDPGLRAMAIRELPKINARLAELRRF